MNQEEKILQLLSEVLSGQTSMKTDLSGLRADVNELRADVNELRADVNELRAGQDQLRADVNELRAGQDTLRADVNELRADVNELRADVNELKQRVLRVEVTQENIVIPQIQLLAEGHTMIQDQIKRLSVIDSMQDDIATLKTAVKFLSRELEELKSAM